jgi:hypothetical protein
LYLQQPFFSLHAIWLLKFEINCSSNHHSLNRSNPTHLFFTIVSPSPPPKYINRKSSAPCLKNLDGTNHKLELLAEQWQYQMILIFSCKWLRSIIPWKKMFYLSWNQSFIWFFSYSPNRCNSIFNHLIRFFTQS